MQPKLRDVPANRVAAKTLPVGAVLALLRAGSRAPALAAAFVVVVAGFAAQTEAEALDVAERDVLYLDAPAVSEERAARAGKAAASLSASGSPAPAKVLAWLSVPVEMSGTGTPPASVARALDSVTALDGEGEGGVTPSDAVLAGEVMVAQLGEPPAKGRREDAELASMGAVRPRFGDEPAAKEGSEPAGSERAERDGQPGGIEYASIEEPPAYAPAPLGIAPVVEPEGGAGVTLPAPARDEESPPSPPFVSIPDEAAAILPPEAEAGGEPPGAAEPVIETPVDEPPGAGPSIEGPAESSEPEAPDAGPTGLEEDGFALTSESDAGEDTGGSGPAEDISRSVPAPPSDEEEPAEDPAEAAPLPGGTLAVDEAPETTSTETPTEATGQRVEVVAIDENASTADTRTSDEFPSEPEVGEAPPTGIQERAEDREPTPEGIAEASQGEGRGLHAEEERLPAGDRVGVPEQTMSDEGFRVPERPRGEERVERRDAGDRSDRDRRVGAADQLARIRSADGGREAVQEKVSDLAGASGWRGADEPEPARETVVRSAGPEPRAAYLRSDVPVSREASGETSLRGQRPAPDGGAVERQTVVVSRELPEREAVQAQQAVEPPPASSAAHHTTDKTRQGGRR